MIINKYKKCELLRFIILVLSGLDSHVLQYMQKVHTYGVNIRYTSEVQFKLSRNERILNKANAFNQYVGATLCAFSV